MINKRKFVDYEIVRRSGLVNMCSARTVADISFGLEDDEVRDIRENYSQYAEACPLDADDLEFIHTEVAVLKELWLDE